MCVCMYVSVCVYVCMYVFLYVGMHICMHVCYVHTLIVKSEGSPISATAHDPGVVPSTTYPHKLFFKSIFKSYSILLGLPAVCVLRCSPNK